MSWFQWDLEFRAKVVFNEKITIDNNSYGYHNHFRKRKINDLSDKLMSQEHSSNEDLNALQFCELR